MHINGKLKRFLKSTSGSITPMLGLAAVPIFLAAGAALDMARVNREQTAFHAAVESAALAIAADDRSATAGLSGDQLTARKAELTKLGKQYIDTNYKSSTGTANDIQLNVDVTGQAVTLTASMEFPTSIMKLVGINSVGLNADTTVKKAMRPIELVMVMDTTGSMKNDGRLSGAKDAAKKLLNSLYGADLSAAPRSEYIRTALVPFAAAVRLDTAGFDFNFDWIDRAGTNPLSSNNFDLSTPPATWNNFTAWSKLKSSSSAYHQWNGCVEARMRGDSGAGTDYNVNDAAPNASDPATLFPAYFSMDTAGNSYGYNYLTGTSTSTTGSECKGLTSAQCSDNSTNGMKLKQENYRKYDGANIGAQSTDNDGPWSGCAASKVVSMTYDRASVEAGVDAMAADGPTLIAEGLSWGWRAISNTEPLTKVKGSGSIPDNTISQYDDVRWQKIMVLMTDGDNDLSSGGNSLTMNKTWYSAYGVTGEALATNRIGTTNFSETMGKLDDAMLNVCSKIKAKNIKLYVASFGSTISSATKTRLKSCASGEAYYQHASTSADLAAFFDHIGEDVRNKSIYVSN